MIAAILIAPHVNGAQWAAPGEGASVLLQGIAMLAAGVLGPPIVARLCWRLHRRRFFADMYLITPH
jgi:hypothetical protein